MDMRKKHQLSSLRQGKSNADAIVIREVSRIFWMLAVHQSMNGKTISGVGGNGLLYRVTS
ncbi:hypothetical protein JMY81_02815 [Brenneria goodwinii]|nr:hypothetical protein [Brenneria goodwinii]MCG8154894.1 hypothetical protein [Brenneria goodwinii]MCG8159769.1 hypothetical protein [Brenneria goodwinii]MCG8164132.1 hypothetical protein [Brenneria goodwinii]MCG8168741.1 hypothetical protein [Brenneria goodwinii]MCG8177806.1 hypothetical protein [Brenneria goodwinii]